MFLFRKKAKGSLGIDIGTSAIKLVELERKDKRHILRAYGIFLMNEYLKDKDKRLNPALDSDAQLAEMIKKVIKEAEIKTRETRLSIPVYSSFSTLINLPAMPEKEISAAIPFEARKYIPIPISDVILDWTVVSDQTSASSGIQVLVVAVTKDFLSRHARIAKLAGLSIRVIEAETFSLARSLIGNDKSTILLIDAGASFINVSIIDSGYARVTRNLEIGGIEFTKEISRKMNISLEEAEEAKKAIRGNEIKEIGQSVLDAISAEIEKIIYHYYNKYNKKIEKYILVGGGASLPGLIDYFISRLGIEISVGDPFARVAYPPVLEPAIKELGPSLAVAVGLAMRD